MCALVGARSCVRARIYACMIIILLYYISIYAGAMCAYVCVYVCAYVYLCPTYMHANIYVNNSYIRI